MQREPRWRPALAIVIAVILYERLPPKLTLGPFWLAPVLIGLLLVPLLIGGDRLPPKLHRVWSITLVAILNFFNIASIILLVDDLVNPHAKIHGTLQAVDLLRYGALIWATNVIVFALWFWEIDAGGPLHRMEKRAACDFQHADFVFPQMSIPGNPAFVSADWKPLVLDYVFLAFNNATAFSPADTFPLTRRAKLLVMTEALTSLITLAVIAARAINILT